MREHGNGEKTANSKKKLICFETQVRMVPFHVAVKLNWNAHCFEAIPVKMIITANKFEIAIINILLLVQFSNGLARNKPISKFGRRLS